MPDTWSSEQWTVALLIALVVLVAVIAAGLTYQWLTRESGDAASDPAQNPVIRFLANEPAMVAGVVGAAAALTAAFGLELSTEQVGAIIAFVSIVLAVLVRQNVTSPATIERSNLRYDSGTQTLKRKVTR